MRLVPTRLFPVLLAALGAALLLPLPASAGDCDASCGPRSYRSGARGSYHGERLRYSRARAAQHGYRTGYGTRHRCRPHATGGSWADLRRYLPEGDEAFRRLRVRAYFLHRYPFAAVDDDEGTASVAHLLAIGDEAMGSERPLDAAGRLDRGTARFHVGDYAGAREDFAALAAEKPDERRAQWGLAMVALCTGRTRAVAERLDALAKLGELRRGDRLSETDTFADASKWKAIVDGLQASSRYKISDGHAFTVTAWALYVSGREGEAASYVRLARRWDGPAAAVKALAANLAPAETAAAPPAEAAPAASGEGPAKQVAQR